MTRSKRITADEANRAAINAAAAAVQAVNTSTTPATTTLDELRDAGDALRASLAAFNANHPPR